MTVNKTSEPLFPKEKEDTIRENYGDWQTNYEFAKSVCLYLKNRGIVPDIVVEPTCGVGNFLAAAIDVFETVKKVYDTGIFIVTDTYEIAWEIIHKVEEAINLLDRSSICVSAITGEVKYDGEDRRYVGELSFTIKKL